MMENDTFSFLLTTDNHMGYKKDDAIRYRDSFMAFAEALEIARLKNADFVLLGGDLFHENRPSSSNEHKCIKIIRKHIHFQENRTVSFRRIAGNFHHSRRLNHANFEDPNMKIACPIMTIHGNHDNPTGPDAQSVCEKLATCGLLNYFGMLKQVDKKLVVEPIVLQKGLLKIALYGMGFMPDYKLKIQLEKGEVVFTEPPPDSFNILVVHQNRVPFQKNRYIPDEAYPKFFHLIVRGHEHNTQRPEIIPESEVNGMVYQPGSTVATSISVMEAAPKKIGLISIKIVNPDGDRASRYKMDYELIDLKCCRVMLLKDISQKEIFKNVKQISGTAKVNAAEFKSFCQGFVAQCIETLLKKCEEDRSLIRQSQSSSSSSQSMSQPEKLRHFDLPIVRIRLEYTSKNERFDELAVVSQFFPKRVANKDIILFKKQKLVQTNDGQVENITFKDDDVNNEEEEQEEFEHVNLGEEKRDTIDCMIEKYFMNKPPDQRLKALSITEYTNAVKGALEDGNVISKVLNEKKNEVFRKFRRAICDEEVAGMKFHDQDFVEKWFIEEFGHFVKDNTKATGGDDINIILS